jgi:branched-chain amino acid transport system substrate-binding protein
VAARTLAAGALALSLGIAACGDDDEGGADAGGGQTPQDVSFELMIGDLVPLTGELSAFGPAGRKSADLAVQQVNEAAQQAGVQTQVTVEHADSGENEQAGVQAARQLTGGGATCMLGDWASQNTQTVASSVTIRQRIPLISPASTSAAITELDDNGFVWRTAPSDNLQAQALADTIEQELGGTDARISLAARNDAYGQGFVEQFQPAWQEKGGQFTGEPVLYDAEQPNYNSEAQQIVANDPDVFVIIDFEETYGRMGAALVRTGDFDPEQMFTADGLAFAEIPEAIPQESLVGARGTRPGTPEQGGVIDAFSQLYTEAGGPKRQTFDAQNFDAAMLCYLAALAAGSAEGAGIAEQLQAVSAPPGPKFNFTQLPQAIEALGNGEDIDFDGVTGPIDFDDNGDPTAATYEVYQYDEEGALQVQRQFQAQQE